MLEGDTIEDLLAEEDEDYGGFWPLPEPDYSDEVL